MYSVTTPTMTPRASERTFSFLIVSYDNASIDVPLIYKTVKYTVSTVTESVRAFSPSESELVPYQACRSSGVLSFWDDPSEDIYSFEDGQPL